MKPRAYTYAAVTTAIVLAFALGESATEKFISDHSRLAGTAIEIAIVVVATLAFRPIHQRVDAFVEAAFTRRRREAREHIVRLQKELSSFNDVGQVLRRVVEAVDRFMSAAGCAVYLRRGAYFAEASSFENSLPAVEQQDALAVRLRSTPGKADPRVLGSSAAGELAFPMMAMGSLIGFLAVTPKGIEYDDDDCDALAALAESAGLALVTLDPELRLPDVPRNNLPQLITSFIGREDEVTEIGTLLREQRLVTLVGSGGVGKTRAALQIASVLSDAFADGAWLVELAPLTDGAQVANAIAQALGVKQSPNRPVLESVVAFLRRKRLLLVLDNCEHLIADVRSVASAIVRGSTDVRILATSREGLNVDGEQLFRMPSLAHDQAMQLFAERARAVEGRFAITDENRNDVAVICRRLDGIPLAIELAAARVRVLSPQQLAEKLDERFRVLTGGQRSALPRHQTMRALIDWSYDLLSAGEQTLFRSLSIFAGGFTLESASAVCRDTLDDLTTLDLLSSLVDKSLVQADPSGAGTRYRMLESTRQYARDLLVQRGENDAVARAHAAAYLTLAEDLEWAYETTADREWDAAIEPEMENWRAALEWSLGARNDVALGRRLAGALRSMWLAISPAQGQRWLHTAVATVDAGTDEAVAARLDLALGQIDASLGRFKAAHEEAERALERYRALRDEQGIAEAERVAGGTLVALGRVAEGEPLLETALATYERLGLRKMKGRALDGLAQARAGVDDFAGARERYGEALEVARAAGCERMEGVLMLNLADLEFNSGNGHAALQLAGEALEGYHAFDRRALCVHNIAAYLIALGRYREARVRAREALALSRDSQAEFLFIYSLQHFAAIAALQTGDAGAPDLARAAKLLGYVDGRLGTLGVPRQDTELREYGRMLPRLHDALGEDDFSKLATEGRGWNEDRAVAEAMLV